MKYFRLLCSDCVKEVSITNLAFCLGRLHMRYDSVTPEYDPAAVLFTLVTLLCTRVHLYTHSGTVGGRMHPGPHKGVDLHATLLLLMFWRRCEEGPSHLVQLWRAVQRSAARTRRYAG